MEIKDVYRGDVAPNNPHLIWIRGTEILLFGKDGWQPLSGSLSTLEELLSEDSVNPIQNSAVYRQYMTEDDIREVLENANISPERQKPLTFTCIEPGDFHLALNKPFFDNFDNFPLIIWYSVNDEEWVEFDLWEDDLIIETDIGDTVSLKSASGNTRYYEEYGETYNIFNWSYMEGKWKVSGNIMSMIDPEGFKSANNMPDKCFEAFFSDLYSDLYFTALVDASELILPATNLSKYCYSFMFDGCSNLLYSPKILPALELSEGCYEDMFSNCESLITVPELPAIKLSEYCYSYMFDHCTSLEVVPKLKAETLTENCYSGMFSGCSSLTKAPELPAENLAEWCYYAMFKECTSLVSAPVLPTLSLKNSCYSNMFKGCTNLNHVKCYAVNNTGINNLGNWLKDVSETGLFEKSNSASYSAGISGIPEGWTVNIISETVDS